MIGYKIYLPLPPKLILPVETNLFEDCFTGSRAADFAWCLGDALPKFSPLAKSDNPIPSPYKYRFSKLNIPPPRDDGNEPPPPAPPVGKPSPVSGGMGIINGTTVCIGVILPVTSLRGITLSIGFVLVSMVVMGFVTS